MSRRAHLAASAATLPSPASLALISFAPACARARCPIRSARNCRPAAGVRASKSCLLAGLRPSSDLAKQGASLPSRLAPSKQTRAQVGPAGLFARECVRLGRATCLGGSHAELGNSRRLSLALLGAPLVFVLAKAAERHEARRASARLETSKQTSKLGKKMPSQADNAARVVSGCGGGVQMRRIYTSPIVLALQDDDDDDDGDASRSSFECRRVCPNHFAAEKRAEASSASLASC